MLKRNQIFVSAIIVVLSLCGAELLAAPPETTLSAVQQKPLVHLNMVQSGSFSEALDALAIQGHTAIVAEGVPFVPHLSKKDAPNLTKPIPLPEAVTQIAASYDYDVQRQDEVFVLTKRYTNPKEMPCVTLEECQQAFHDILALLDRFNPNFDEASGDHSQRSSVVNFFNSLSPKQLQGAQSKTLHYGELEPEQRKIVESLLLYGFVQFPSYKLRETVSILDYAPKSVITGRAQGQTALFIEAPVPANNLLRYYQPLAGGISPPDQSSPLILPKQTETGNSPVPMTLESVVKLLPYTGPPAVVDNSLKDKPVFVTGLKNVSPRNVLRALKVLYNLRIGSSDAGGEMLMRQILPTSNSLRDLGPNAWDLLPVSITRAIRQKNAANSQLTFPNKSRTQESMDALQRSREADQRLRQQLEVRTLLPALWSESVHQVLVGVQPQLRSGGLDARIPVRTLSGSVRRALAVALIVSSLEEMQSAFTGQINQNITDCLDDMNSILVYTIPAEASVVHGQSVPSIYFEGTNPYTKQQIGLGGAHFSTSK